MMFNWTAFVSVILFIVLFFGSLAAFYGGIVLLENRRPFVAAAVYVAIVLVWAAMSGFMFVSSAP